MATAMELPSLEMQDIGGIDDIVEELVSQITLLNAFATEEYETRKPRGPDRKGIMLIGKPGTGKTALAVQITTQKLMERAECSGLPYKILNCPDVFRTEEGASEAIIAKTFSSLTINKLSIVILDEIDMIASESAVKKAGVEARAFDVLMSELDKINQSTSTGYIFVIGLTNRAHAIHPALTRSGRLDRVIELNVKTPIQRESILHILSKKIPFKDQAAKQSIVHQVAQVTHGFVPTDLQSLCRQVVLALVKEEALQETQQAVATFGHFESALQFIKPSNFNEYQTKIPDVRFKDLYGIDNAIRDLKISVIDPFRDRSEYIKLGINPPRGVLVYGPPGVGKTTLCCALGAELGINFMLVEGSQVRSKVVGESEKNVAKMFAQARANSPCILFIDQIDALVPKRGTSSSSENTSDRIVTGFLTELDGFFTKSSPGDPSSDVLIIAATNRPQVIDPAILRPGRIDEHIHLPAPGKEERKLMFLGLSQNIPMDVDKDEFEKLADELEGWTGSDIDNLCREAALVALRENINSAKVVYAHLLQAKQACRPSLPQYGT
ncbi:unnamed protein product [Umbelopsis vinacea]